VTSSDQSLSVVLPVYNAQNTLPHLIHQMLEILPDVTSEFEVLVIDDGSTDQTEEVARDLAIEYPQVRVTRHAERLGGEEVIRTGYERTRGKVVIVQQENTAFGQADLRRLCEMHAEPADPSAEMHPTRLDSATEDYLAAWSLAFRNRMRPPSREQLDKMAAHGMETAESGETKWLRMDEGVGEQRVDSKTDFPASDPRSSASRS
jgi:hypothetical protein